MIDEKQSIVDMLNTKAGHILGVGAATTVWTTYLDLGIKVITAFYLCVLIYSMIRSMRKK